MKKLFCIILLNLLLLSACTGEKNAVVLDSDGNVNVVDRGNLVETALNVLFATGGIGNMYNSSLVDFQLEHFGIKSKSTLANIIKNR